ncbi:SDR family NAD(P)-dependent oxidoreductase [Nocardia lijiangensis]|uniref:SDR family NAD(P)-dependent oxidoreductase n=1 Tax=Nocardia lijiangensis TaxID=299618 RepID=UPI00082B4F3F|nr:SDR family NAD(P)-dependent oxidoreductase [Nocardia lijiangensis]
MSKKTLAGKRVAITGGAHGVGRETALAFIAAGAHIALGDRDTGRTRAVAEQFARMHGGTVVGLALDTTDSARFAEFLARAERKLGGLDVVVNAADAEPTGSFLSESEAESDHQIDVNLRAVVTGSRLAGRRFVEQGHGHIVNIGSAVGVTAAMGAAVYSATKHAVVGLGTALHRGLAEQGVLVSTIAPGYAPAPEMVADAIVDCVEHRRGGLVVVPPRGRFRTATPDSARLRRTMLRMLGMV